MQSSAEMKCPSRLPGIGCALLLAAVAAAAGCQRPKKVDFVSAPALSSLDVPLQQEVRRQLGRLCGTRTRPKLLGEAIDSPQLQYGASVYERYCAQCHGPSGDGAGPAAEFLTPRPRDYRKGTFKFNSTGYGNKPRREDLIRTIRQGIVGTSMPSFERLPKRDLEAVVDYVLTLTHRGELETLLIYQSDSDGELSDAMADELAQSIAAQWRSAADQVVEPVSKEPTFDTASVALGKEIYRKRECFKCHGNDGRGGLAGGIEVGKDAWGNVTAAADLTSGMLHGGHRPVDVYRRIYSGINGTPMPEFKNLLASEPDSVWHLAHFVLDMADQRRRGVQIPAGATSAEGGVTRPAELPAPDPEETDIKGTDPTGGTPVLSEDFPTGRFHD